MPQSNLAIDRIRAWLVVIATLATIFVNWYAATGRLNGVAPSDISDTYPSVITPAGYAFTIWSVIYLGLIAFSIYQLLPANLERYRPLRSLYVASCTLNCIWIFLWHSDQIAAAFVVICLLFVVLFLINLRTRTSNSAAEALCVRVPFAIYLGWLAAATLANLAITLVAVKVDLGDKTALFGASLLLIAAAFGVLVRFRFSNYVAPLAIAWALTAIAVKQSGNTLVVSAAAVGVVACLIASLSFVVTHEGPKKV